VVLGPPHCHCDPPQRSRPPASSPSAVGGTLTDSDHRLLAFVGGPACAEHVLHFFESVAALGPRGPREAIEQIRAWNARRDQDVSVPARAGGHAMAAARELSGAARHVAYAAGQAAVGGGACRRARAWCCGPYADQGPCVRRPPDGRVRAPARLECRWQRRTAPGCDSRTRPWRISGLRNEICWSVLRLLTRARDGLGLQPPTSASTRVNLAPLWNLLDLTRGRTRHRSGTKQFELLLTGGQTGPPRRGAPRMHRGGQLIA